jgi:hypothetical protein
MEGPFEYLNCAEVRYNLFVSINAKPLQLPISLKFLLCGIQNSEVNNV